MPLPRLRHHRLRLRPDQLSTPDSSHIETCLQRCSRVMTDGSGFATRLHRNLHNRRYPVPLSRTLRFPERSAPIRRRFDDLTSPARGRDHMRRWFTARATGALLALMLVVASTATAFAD